MAIQITDASGNPVIPTEPIANPNQQVADTQGSIINPAREDGNLLFLKNRLDGAIDSNNSTSTPLGVGGVFTGLATEVLDTASVVVSVFSSHASAANGLVIEWSSDGINWDSNDTFNVPANKGKFFTFGPEARYFRVRYTNGAVSQTSFRLQVTLKPFAIKPSSHRIADSISDDDDAELSKAVITGLASDGTYKNAKMTASGSLYMARLIEGELEKGTLFIANINRNSTGAPETVTLLKNEGATSIRIYSADLFYDSNSQWELYLNPTITTNGTARPTINLNSGSVLTTSAVLYDAPTVSANGTLLFPFQVAANTRQLAIPGVIILAAGHSLLLRRVNSGAGNLIQFSYTFGTNNI